MVITTNPPSVTEAGHIMQHFDSTDVSTGQTALSRLQRRNNYQGFG